MKPTSLSKLWTWLLSFAAPRSSEKPFYLWPFPTLSQSPWKPSTTPPKSHPPSRPVSLRTALYQTLPPRFLCYLPDDLIDLLNFLVESSLFRPGKVGPALARGCSRCG